MVYSTSWPTPPVHFGSPQQLAHSSSRPPVCFLPCRPGPLQPSSLQYIDRRLPLDRLLKTWELNSASGWRSMQDTGCHYQAGSDLGIRLLHWNGWEAEKSQAYSLLQRARTRRDLAGFLSGCGHTFAKLPSIHQANHTFSTSETVEILFGGTGHHRTRPGALFQWDWQPRNHRPTLCLKDCCGQELQRLSWHL